MSNNKIIGIALIIIGAGLLFWGYDIYESAGSKISRAISGEAPMKAYAFMIGGAVAIVLGILKVK
jgi:drug/metabolite transporter (DMT)-like permease